MPVREVLRAVGLSLHSWTAFLPEELQTQMNLREKLRQSRKRMTRMTMSTHTGKDRLEHCSIKLNFSTCTSTALTVTPRPPYFCLSGLDQNSDQTGH